MLDYVENEPELMKTCSDCVNCNNHGEYFSCDAQDSRTDDWVIGCEDEACGKFSPIEDVY